MAEFKIRSLEGTQYVEIHLAHEVVRTEAGAMRYIRGKIDIHSRVIPSIGGAIKSLIAEESIYRPTYFGTGVVTLESTLGGYHVVELDGESWILERGTYWASEGDVDVGFRRERMMPSLWAGEGFVYLQTRVRGHGKVVLATRGPVEEVVLEKGQRVAAQGYQVIARTGDVTFRMRRATKNFFGRFTAGEHRLRVFEGPGRVLVNPAPYWRLRVMSRKAGGDPGSPDLTS